MSAELRALAKKATPGPWSVGYEDGSGPTYITAIMEPERLALRAPGEVDRMAVVSGGPDSYGIDQGVLNPADAAYIAAASPDVILALLDERDAAIRRAEAAEETLARIELTLALRSQESQKPPETEVQP